jgi:hypothetical protein
MLQSSYTSVALEDNDLLDLQGLIDPVMSTAQSLAELGIRFFVNLLVCWALVHFFYYPKSRRKDYVFTFLTFSSAMLLLLFAMGRVDVGVGLTLGLFAIFGVIRYRTETVPIREMTYLFAIIALAAVNGLTPLFTIAQAGESTAHYALNQGDLLIMLSANLLSVLLIWILESRCSRKKTASKIVLYDRVDLITPDRREELLQDLRKRLGLNVTEVEIGNVDFLKDSAYIKIYYQTDGKEAPSTIDNVVKYKQFTEDQNI